MGCNRCTDFRMYDKSMCWKSPNTIETVQTIMEDTLKKYRPCLYWNTIWWLPLPESRAFKILKILFNYFCNIGWYNSVFPFCELSKTLFKSLTDTFQYTTSLSYHSNLFWARSSNNKFKSTYWKFRCFKLSKYSMCYLTRYNDMI